MEKYSKRFSRHSSLGAPKTSSRTNKPTSKQIFYDTDLMYPVLIL